ncbi:hypothetical protein L2E82_26219 [Cichorium intybus]|uniref:Uncharacterized protein n=1 Tax=Cichorium intybus TaxID=13427 RepID=A0ACB9E527_CICIN|nr:hypothetical protein L2E82_26219 [Cichorium intybus]
MDVRNRDEVILRMKAAVARKQYGQEDVLCPLIADVLFLSCQNIIWSIQKRGLLEDAWVSRRRKSNNFMISSSIGDFRGHIALAKLMFRMFMQFHNFMEVEYLPVMSPSQHHKESAARFGERTGRAIASDLNVVQTYHSFADYALLSKAVVSGQEETQPHFSLCSLRPRTFLKKML